jgi:predicted AAA+ superfamily ATPase
MGPMAGAIFENYIITEIIKSGTHSRRNEDYYFLRTQNGEEVDLIIDNRTEKTFIEIKKTSTFKADYMKAITAFKSDTDKGYVLYSREDITLSDSTGFRNYDRFLME